MNKPHKYAKEIIHWANEGTIQWRLQGIIYDSSVNTKGEPWKDWDDDSCPPNFGSSSYKWRIKPEVLRYRVALYKNGLHGHYYPRTFTEEMEHEEWFIRWITD